MKKKIFLITAAACVLGLSITVSADQKAEETNKETQQISTPRVVINTPVCQIIKFRFGVQYHWTTGEGADDISVSTSPIYYNLIGDTTFDENIVVNSYNPSICPSYYDCAASYYSSLDTYSSFKYSTDFNDGQYGRCMFPTRNYFNNPYGASQIPCNIDQEGFIWNHEGSSSSTFYATVAYNNDMVDVEVDIPFLGYRSVDFVVGGQSFRIRTGPNRASICANGGRNIPINDFAMAFKAM